MQIAFVNPPHADWSLANNMTYLIVQSYYNRFGKYANQVEWIPAPYKWDKYESYDEVIQEIIDADVIMFSSQLERAIYQLAIILWNNTWIFYNYARF